MPELDALTGGSRPITEMSDEAEQMTHRAPVNHPDAAIARSIMSILGSPITEMADVSARSQQAMETWAAGGKMSGRGGEAGAETVSERKSRLKREEGAAAAEEQRKTEAARSEASLKEIEARSQAASAEAARQADIRKTEFERAEQAKRDEEQRQLDMSFREKHPLLSQVFAGAGWAVSVALPYTTRLLNIRSSNKFITDLQALATETNKAIADGEARKASTLVNQLVAKEKQAKDMDKDGKLSKMLLASSMLAPGELSALPEEYDIAFGTPTARERAVKELSPVTYSSEKGFEQGNPLRLPVAGLQGFTLGSIGAKGYAGHRLPVPEGQASAAKKSLKELRAEQTKEKTAAAKKDETPKPSAKLRAVGSKDQQPFEDKKKE